MDSEIVSWSELLRALVRKGRYQQAEATLLEALKVVDNKAEIHRMLGILRYMEGKKQRAIESLREGVHHAPQDPVLSLLLGGWLMEEERPEEALPYLEKTLKLQPDNPVAALQVVQAHYGMKNWEKVVECADQALEMGIEEPGLLGALAFSLGQLNRLEEAIGVLHAALELDPRDVSLYVTLVPLSLRACRKIEAQAALEFIVAHTENPTLRAQSAFQLEQLQKDF